MIKDLDNKELLAIMRTISYMRSMPSSLRTELDESDLFLVLAAMYVKEKETVDQDDVLNAMDEVRLEADEAFECLPAVDKLKKILSLFDGEPN